MSIKEQVRKAASAFIVQAELASYERAKVGRKNDDGGVSIAVPKRPDFIFVTKADSTVTIALNRGTVPLQYGLPIKMRVEAGIYVVQGRDRVREAPGTGDDNDYGVNPHNLNTHTDVTITSPVDDQFLRYNGTNWVNETVAPAPVTSVNGQTGVVVLDSDDIGEGATNLWFTAPEETKLAGIEALADVTDAVNVGSAIDGAAAKVTPVDADTMPLIDSAASNVLKKVTWANIKATLKTYMDTLYTAINTAVLLTGDQTVAGIKTFSSRIVGSILRAVDSNGLRLEDDAGNLGIIVHDGGRVTIGGATAGELLEVTGTGAAQAIRVKTTSAHASFIEANSDSDALRMRMQANVTSGFFGTITNHAVSIVTNSTAKATVTAAGDMGIGETSPSGKLSIQAGTSSDHANAGGVLYVTTTQTGNVGTGQDDLASFSVPANTLAVNNQSLWFEASGTTVNTAASKNIYVYFGGTQIAVRNLSSSVNYQWIIRGRIYRVGPTTQRANVMITNSGGTPLSQVTITTTSITLSSAAILKVVGEAAANDDVVLNDFIVGWSDRNT